MLANQCSIPGCSIIGSVKLAALSLITAIACGYAQTRPAQCGTPPTLAANSPVGGAAGKQGPGAAKTAPAGTAAQVRSVRPQLAAGINCWCGSVAANSLISNAASQEVTIVAGLPANFRFDHLLLTESIPFSSDQVAGLRVSAGTAGKGDEFLGPFPLKSTGADQNFVYDRPLPLMLSGVYDLVLKFSAPAAATVGTGILSNFTAGNLKWEVCGYQVP